MEPGARKGKAARASNGRRRFQIFFTLCASLPAAIGLHNPAMLFAQESKTVAAAVSDSLPSYSVPNVTATPESNSPKLLAQTWFGHDLLLYTWQSQIRFHQALPSRWQLQVLGNLNSLLQPQSAGDLWKDDHQAGVQLSRPLPGGGRLEFLSETRIFRDALTGGAASDFGNNDFSSSRVRFNPEWLVGSRLRVAPNIGYRWENILNRREHGPAAGLNVALAPMPWADYTHLFEGAATVESLPERRNEDAALLYGVSRQFVGSTTDSLFARFNHLRRENYFTTEYVDLVQRNRRALENRLHYRLQRNWRFFIYSEIGEAEVEVARRTLPTTNAPAAEISRFRYEDLESSHAASLFFEKYPTVNEVSWYYRSRRRAYQMPDSLRASPLIRRYASEGYDSDLWDFALLHRLQWRIGSKDSLRWFGRFARWALTTANLEDPNDHDRLHFQANLLYVHRFNDFFSMGWEARSYLEHQIYLKKNLSGDNRWMRIWQLLPYLLFEPFAGLQFKQGFGVRATYIDYDFPETLSQRKSVVFRDFFLTDSLTYTLSSRTTVTLQYRLALEERGLLDWERWLQSPQTEVRRHWAVVSFWHRWLSHWEISPGVSFYRESHWQYQSQPLLGLQRIFTGTQTIIRPMLQISYVRPPAVLLLFNWRRQMSFRTLADNRLLRDRNIDTFNLTVQWGL